MPTYSFIPPNTPTQYPAISLVDETGTIIIPGGVGTLLASRKSSDQAVVNATLADITGMSLALAANEVQIFQAFVVYDSTTSNDMKLGFTVPAGAAIAWGATGIGTGATSAISSVNVSAIIASGGTVNYGGIRAAGAAASRVILMLRGTVVNGSTAGTLQMQAAKFNNTDTTSPADDLTIYANSHISAQRVS